MLGLESNCLTITFIDFTILRKSRKPQKIVGKLKINTDKL